MVQIISDLCIVFFCLFFITHWCACLFFLVAYQKDISGDYETWLDLVDPEDKLTIYEYYIHSMFWSFTTITSTNNNLTYISGVGYGDLYAVSENEKLVAIFVLMIACGVFAILVGLMAAIFDKSDAIVSDLSDKIIQVDSFLSKNKIDIPFREKVRTYLFFLTVLSLLLTH